MAFTYLRTIHFRDTDAAGVVYFANVLSICHEAYEASLAAAQIDLKSFFTQPRIAFPIVHANVDFFQPLFCGDRCCIRLHPTLASPHRFEIHYEIVSETKSDSCFAKAITKHVAIDATKRVKVELPASIRQWLVQWGDPTEQEEGHFPNSSKQY
jgi:1,4-dihydroxy-2-naphthoyl-CoA hydrolase